jgi:cytoskeletal protein RodZ
MTLPQNVHGINKYGVSTKVPFRSRFAGRRHKSLILILLFLFCFAVLGWLGYKNMSNGTFWHSKTDIASNNDELDDSKTSRSAPSSSTSSSLQPISIQAATASSTPFMTSYSNECCS